MGTMTATNPINRTSSTSGTTDASRTSHASSTSTSSSTSGTSGAGRMSAAEAQWVRRHAWTAAMRKTYCSTHRLDIVILTALERPRLTIHTTLEALVDAAIHHPTLINHGKETP